MSKLLQVRSLGSRGDRQRFIDFPKVLYAESEEWVPMFDSDMRAVLSQSHPYFAHSDGEAFLVERDGSTVGRFLVTENRPYNKEHEMACAHFYFFDFIDDPEVVQIAVARIREWAHGRGLSSIRGPLLFGGTTGGGVLVKGFEVPAAMTMMPYNYAYYAPLLESAGFVKAFDLHSLSLDPATFVLPERVAKVADRVLVRGRMQVLFFPNKRKMRSVAKRVSTLYNPTLADHPENYPLSDAELELVINDIMLVSKPDLMKVITYDGEPIGYVFGFPDLTEVLQRNGGKIGPLRILRLLRATKRPRKVLINGMGISAEYQRLGGNALLYAELTRTILNTPGVVDAELVQVAESTELMLRDLHTLGAKDLKLHRVYDLVL